MKYRILVLLMLASSFQAKSVQKLSNTELSFILSSMEVLYKNKSFPQIRVIQSWESQTECDGEYQTCPNARLFISVNTGDLYEVPALFELPKSKGWQYVSFVEHDDSFLLMIKTTLDHANISAESRSKWRSKSYAIKISKYEYDVLEVIEK
ncbi:hypothetical protein [Pseudoalteromonas shioyasakiensis]|uniref:hypothetical protein n=1 Tax=Pseudoalteromonas shioyasakiensis TaxID=1190813 RepID=UPI0007842EBB|nr:hypothetical protein [Pseudoalteromonas shioyasakiensis]